MPPPCNHLVGVRFPVWSAVGPGTLSGLVDHMRSHETWRLVTENDSFGEMEATRIDENWQGDGVILFRATEAELTAFRQRGMGVVLTSTEGPDLGFPRVVPDNHQIGRIAARHLIECNLPHFAFLARGETFYREEQYAPGLRVYARLRLRGFREELERYSLEPRVHYLCGRPLWKAHSWREIQNDVMDFLKELPLPCGLFVADDSLGAVVLRAADELGLDVPGQLAVIGYGDDPNYCYSTFPALSSIAHPAREIGKLAAALLGEQMAGNPVASGSRIVPVAQVVARESSNTLAVADPEIRELIRHIRLQAPREAMRVAELEERSSLSMTTIKERFAAVLGHGPKHEIQRVRLRHLQHLLGIPALSLGEISQRMNFGSTHELSRFFKSATGMRPSEYRANLLAMKRTHATKAVIFDMDGTLFDTEPIYWEAFSGAFAEQGGELGRDEYFSELLGTANPTIEHYLAAKAPAGFDLERFRSRWRKRWKSLMANTPLVPLPGVKSVLEMLLEQGVPVALASSSTRDDIDLSLEAAGLSGYFSSRSGGDEVGSGKPAPDIYLLACRRLGMAPEDCIAVEDSPHGVTAALAAGLQVIWVTVRDDDDASHVRKVGDLTRLTDGDWRKLLAKPPAE